MMHLRADELCGQIALRTALPQSPNTILHPGTGTPSIDVDPSDPPMPATIPSDHTSATEEVLNWSIFAPFPALHASNYSSISLLEYNRPSLQFQPFVAYLKVSEVEVQVLVDAFQRNVNFWYPVTTVWTAESVWTRVRGGEIEQDVESCASLMILALGSACLVVERLETDETAGESVELKGDVYFDAAMKLLPLVTMENSALSVQCLFHVG